MQMKSILNLKKNLNDFEKKIFIIFLPEILLPMIEIVTWLSGLFPFNCVVLSQIQR